MKPDDFQSVSDDRFHADPQAVDQAEAALGIKFPVGYRDFIARFGEGLLAGNIRVFPPYQILDGDLCVPAWRERIGEYWFWDSAESVMPKERALECVLIADTLDGDELVFHPAQPDRIYVLPRYDETSYLAGDGLWPAIDWLLTSAVLFEAVEDRTFQPFDGKATQNG